MCCERGETERWAIQCCVLREERKLAVSVIVLCAEIGENSTMVDKYLCGESRGNRSVGETYF